LVDVPTYQEAGIAGLEIEQWLAVFAPAGTPAPVVQRLNAEIGKALGVLGIRERYAQAAMEPVGGDPENLARLLRNDYEKYGRLIKELGIRAD
jgi:tripartite-type tricarboxylate transporter receptor subunit TctC